VDLIAGGGNEKSEIDVGDILVWNDADFLYVQYILDDGWCLTETHLHVASDLVDIPQTKKKNPIPGHFTYNDEWDPCKTEHTYPIPLLWPSDVNLYIAAHAVVKKIIGYQLDLAGFEEDLPDQVTMALAHPGTTYGDPSYFDVTITGGTSLDGIYDNYCIDTDQFITPGDTYTANVYSSYEDLPEGLVEFPENLDLVNWIINQDYVGQSSSCGGDYTYGDVQRAIWALIEDTQSNSGLGPWSQCRVDEILDDASSNGEGFEPECGDVVAVILAPIDDSQFPIAQVTFAEVELPCIPIYQEETAWGDGVEFNTGKNWATYFIYTVQGEIPIIWPESGTITVAFEDLRIGDIPDYDYNDWVVDIETIATFWGTTEDPGSYLVRMDFIITPEARGAGYEHNFHLLIPKNTFGSDGEYNLTIYDENGDPISGFPDLGDFYADSAEDFLVIPLTSNALPGSLTNTIEPSGFVSHHPDIGNTDLEAPEHQPYVTPQRTATLTIIFDQLMPFDLSAFDPDDPHGEGLFFDPWLKVQNTGNEIHVGDPRILTVPIDWMWPEAGVPIWLAYDEGVTSGNPPSFTADWWLNYNDLVYNGKPL
jgi:hypothetical protein